MNKNGRMGEWENGRKGEWENGRMGEWEKRQRVNGREELVSVSIGDSP
jgi:hypothetical protein